MAACGGATRRLFARRLPIEEGTAIQEGWIVQRGAGQTTPLVPLSAVHLIGPHMVDDVMAAATVGAITGVSPSAMTAAVEAFGGLEHAMELVASIGNVRFVNDSKATNIESAVRSLESFDAGVVPIIGGRHKGGDFERLRIRNPKRMKPPGGERSAATIRRRREAVGGRRGRGGT